MTKNSWLNIANVYISPVGNVGFSSEMKLESVSTTGIVAGDFNGHSELWDEFVRPDNRSEEILEWANDFDMTILNDGSPTRINPKDSRPSTPDVSLADSRWASKCQWSDGEDIGASDHFPVTIKFNSSVATKKIAQRRPKWKSNVNWQPFTDETEEKIDEMPEGLSLKEEATRFTEILIEVGRKHVGKVKVGGRRKMCIHPEVRKAIRKRNLIRKDMANRRSEWKNACVEVKDLKLAAKEKAWRDYLDEAINEKDDAKIHKIVRSLNGCPDTNNPNEALSHNNRTVTSDIRKADVFIQHYSAVSRHKFSKEDRDLNRESKKILSTENSHEGPCGNFTMKDLEKAIKKMNKKSAPGQDDIPPSFIIHLGPIGRQRLLDIFNTSFNTSEVPQIWRNAIVIPLLKAGKPASDVASFRPISLTSCIVKLFERLIVNRIVTMAESNNWFHKYQAGFRKGRNCTDQILRLVQQVDDGFQRKEKSVLALLDLSKAYDRVWKEKLIVVMHEAGVPVKFLKWIRSFLSNRQAKVRFNNAEGHTKGMKQGLPQGSVLAPILFLFYINTLATRLPSTTTNSLFADDVSIMATDKTLEKAQSTLQVAVDIVRDWAIEYKMDLSPKSEVTFFSMSTKDKDWRPSVLIGNTPIKFAESPRMLGVYLDRSPCFTKQVDFIKQQVAKKCRVIGAVSNSEWG